MRKTSRLLLAAVAALALLPAPALGCSLERIAGTWLLSVDATWADDYFPGPPAAFREQCWLKIGVAGNVGVHCENTALFGLGWDPEIKPWHAIERATIAKTETVNGRRFPVPNRCQWRLYDRNDMDIEYQVNVAPDFMTLQGHGEGKADKHYGSTEPFEAFFVGLRQ